MILLATAVPFFLGTDTGTCALEFFLHGTRGVTNSNSMFVQGNICCGIGTGANTALGCLSRRSLDPMKEAWVGF